MYDHEPQDTPLSARDRWISGLLLVAFMGLFVAEVCHDFQPVKFSALLVPLFWIPLLALHEAGHAVAATLLNWYVGQIVIGMGKLIGRFRLGAAQIEIRLIPIEGFVKCVPKDLNLPHLKSALIYFAGPGIELLLAGCILLAVGSERLFTPTDDYLLIVWQSLALASAAQAVLNLIPAVVRTPRGNIVNDGLGIIRSFMLPKAYYADMIGHTYNEGERAWEAYDPADWWKRDG